MLLAQAGTVRAHRHNCSRVHRSRCRLVLSVKCFRGAQTSRDDATTGQPQPVAGSGPVQPGTHASSSSPPAADAASTAGPPAAPPPEGAGAQQQSTPAAAAGSASAADPKWLSDPINQEILSIAMPVRDLSLPWICSSNTSQQHVHKTCCSSPGSLSFACASGAGTTQQLMLHHHLLMPFSQMLATLAADPIAGLVDTAYIGRLGGSR